MLSNTLRGRLLFVEDRAKEDKAKIVIDHATKGLVMALKSAVMTGALSQEDAEKFAICGLEFYETLIMDMDDEQFSDYLRCQHD